MPKKHTNRFNVVFNPISEHQQFAIDVLNGLPPRSLAVYLGEAIYAYEHKSKNRKPKPETKINRTRKSEHNVQTAEESETPDTDDTVQTSAEKSLTHTSVSKPAEQESEIASASPQMLSSMIAFMDMDTN